MVTYMQLSVWRLYSGAFNWTDFDESHLTTFCLSTLLAFLDRNVSVELKYISYIHTAFYTISLAMLSFLPQSNSWELSESGRARFRWLPYRELPALNGLLSFCQLAGIQVFIQRWCRRRYLVSPRNGCICLAPALP